MFQVVFMQLIYELYEPAVERQEGLHFILRWRDRESVQKNLCAVSLILLVNVP